MPPKRYQKLGQVEHILKRPDMYVGSTRNKTITDYVACYQGDGNYKIIQKDIKVSPALSRIFIEILSNAVDNVERSKKTSTPCKNIKVTYDSDTSEFSVWNDGDIIPIDKNNDEDCYNHSMIFGQLLTGSNYDDEEERVVAGRNGLGSKVCNIFSTKFTVKACDPNNGLVLSQVWTNNMRETEGPKVKKSKEKKGYTQVSWIADLSHFGIKKYSDDIINLYLRYIIDASMITKINIYYNGNLIPIKNLSDYSSLYDCPTDEKLYIKTRDAEVVLTPATEFGSITFVNGVYTRLGGQHLDSWSEALFRPIIDKFNGKDKKVKTKTPKININDVKQFFRIFVVSTVVRPEFDGQDKNKLESPEVVAEVKKTHITNILKWSVIDNIEDIIRSKEMCVLKKAEKVTKKTKVEGYDKANKAGSKDSNKCSLFVTEGLSAKTYVVAGIKEGIYGRKGRDWNGVLPVRGKLLNVRDKAPTSITDNKVICNLIHALGLKHGVDYTQDEHFNKLNYGRLVIVADADVDGIHIEGLILNFIHFLYPTLLKRDESFVISLKTPIARITKKGKGNDLLFYDEINFNKWLDEQPKKVDIKYYKGLGTTKAEDVPDTFGKKLVQYVNDNDSFHNMQKAFHKKHADMRKEWLGDFIPSNQEYSLDKVDSLSNMNISQFINNELIKFSHADCGRSIPNGIDGLKESQRKILYAVKKKGLKYNGKSLKVAQLAGYTAEHSNYHHGEKNLYDTIIGMAQEFNGTNNIPLLYRDGMFGTILEGGQDAADGRYIFTKMDALTELIYRSEDEPLLKQVNDDGDLVQPEFYVPILPMLLINGVVAGIGTGWSSNIPCYNPLDIIRAIKTWIENDGEVLIEDPDTNDIHSLFDDIHPWYRNFKGSIKKETDTRYITNGVVQKTKSGVEVSELPIGLWTSKFADLCDDLKSDKKLKSVSNYSTPKSTHFVLKEEGKFVADVSSLKLHSYLYTSNLVAFDDIGKLNKYDTVSDILDNFCKVRYEYYTKRKIYMLNNLKKELRHMGNKERFISEVINDELEIMKVKEENLIKELEKRGYDKEDDSYEYLLRLQVRVFTVEKVSAIKNDIKSIKQKIDNIKKTSEAKMWSKELDEFETAYTKWLAVIDK